MEENEMVERVVFFADGSAASSELGARLHAIWRKPQSEWTAGESALVASTQRAALSPHGEKG